MANVRSTARLVQNAQDHITDVQKLLVLKCMTQYVEKDFHKSVTGQAVETLPENKYKAWRKFLDKLSYICDFNSGGSTVAGIAAQATGENNVFWLYPNCISPRTRDLMLEHLKFVMQQLVKETESATRLAAIICWRSIELSSDKVQNYRGKLERELNRIKVDSEGVVDVQDIPICEAVETLLQVGIEDHHDLCAAARDFVAGGIYKLLQNFASQPESRYNNVRHYICRLSSWHTAASHLVKSSRTFKRVLHGAEAKLTPSEVFKAPTTVHFSKDDDETLSWILGSHKQPYLEPTKRRLAFARGFLQKHGGKPHETIIHAEAAVAHFFYTNRFQFVFDDRYIGCSKQSCYACSVYLSKHPGDFVNRPAHGNAWYKWYPPRLAARHDARMTSSVLRDMAEHMQEDLNAVLQGNDLGRRRPHESTSGIESTVRRMHEAFASNGDTFDNV